MEKNRKNRNRIVRSGNSSSNKVNSINITSGESIEHADLKYGLRYHSCGYLHDGFRYILVVAGGERYQSGEIKSHGTQMYVFGTGQWQDGKALFGYINP